MTKIQSAIQTIQALLPIQKSKLPEEAHEAYDVLTDLTEGFTDFADLSAFPEFEALFLEFTETVEALFKKKVSVPKLKPQRKASTTTKKKTSTQTEQAKPSDSERLKKALETLIRLLKAP